jgi:uncharacterized protein YndB with AHSA1/START domain
MKITKEVTISATKDDIWAWLTDRRNLQGIWGPGIEVDLRKNGFVTVPGVRKSWRVAAVKPLEKLTLNANAPALPTTTTVDLITKGRRTSLKVTINGWEKIDSDRARLEMPRVSLEWEKNLNRIKQAIETGLKRRATAR